jgi:GDP-L-fucose synthase
MHVDDFAEAMAKIIKKYNKIEPINVGSGQEISIFNLARKISKVVDFKGKIIFDKKYPDGTPRKLLNISKIRKLGWKPKISLLNGITKSVNDYNKLINY